MANVDVWESVRDLVRHQDLTTAIELVESWLKGRLHGPKRQTIRDLLDELLLHYASVNSVRISARRGLITKEEEGVQLRQVSRSILALVTEIEGEELPAVIADVGPLPARYEQGKFEKIIGTRSHLQMVSWLEEGLKCSTGVCRLISGRCMGTGFRANGDLVITNNHVIGNVNAARDFIAQFFFEERTDHSMRDIVTVELDANRFWTSEELDITIVGGSFGAPSAHEIITPLEIKSSATVSVGDPVSIIQHPLGGPKQIAFTANEVINLYGHRIQYVTDTMPGSSGAPVFDTSWNVVAVHHAGGNLLRNVQGDKVFANEGISIPSFATIPDVRGLLEVKRSRT